MSPWRPLERDDEPRPVSASLDRIVGRMGAPRAAALSAVFDGWAAIVGEGVAAHARPRTLRKGTLVVDVDDGAWATELRSLGPRIIERCNAAAGPEIVEKIEVRVRPGMVG